MRKCKKFMEKLYLQVLHMESTKNNFHEINRFLGKLAKFLRIEYIYLYSKTKNRAKIAGRIVYESYML